jgi:hypothetical protein
MMDNKKPDRKKENILSYYDQFFQYAVVFCLKHSFLGYPPNKREEIFDLFIDGFKRTIYAKEKPYMDALDKLENNELFKSLFSSMVGDSEDILRDRDAVLNSIEDKFRDLLVSQD